MANSKITITFGADADVADWLSFKYRLIGDTVETTLLETFVLNRVQNYQITAPPVISLDGTDSATRYVDAFNIDYNGFSAFTVSRVANEVTIQFTSDLYEFLDFQTNFPSITSIIENFTPSTFSLVSAITSASVTDVCGKYQLDVTATEPIKSLIINGQTVTVDTPNVLKTIGLTRAVPFTISMVDVSDLVVYVGDFLFGLLDSGNIVVNAVNSLIGATVTVNITNVDNLVLEYSLDNVNWQDSNIFTGQGLGTKFLYVRDQFGCVKSKEYTVTELGSREPFFRISKANSINFSKKEVWDGCTIFKNDENTLDCQGLSEKLYRTDNLFQTCDTTIIQFKSNYETNSAVLRDSDGNDTVLSVVKKSLNLNRFQSLDAKYYKYRDGKLGVYFESGNKYDEFGSIIGTYTLNGNLPEFAIIGQFITINTLGTFQIKDILTDDSINKRIIVVDYSYNGLVTDTKVQSIYDILDYEVYEFGIDWSLFTIGKYNVVITATDSINGIEIHNSERISLATEHKNTLAISYSNNNNRDIFYKYGIVNFIRVPYIRFVPKQQDDNEISITDDNSVVVESSVYEKNEIKFDVISNSLMRKLVVALSCENLFVNGVGYVKDGNIDTENIDNTNLHEVTATLIKTNISYTNFKQGQTGIDSGSATFEAPQIITTGTNFIKA